MANPVLHVEVLDLPSGHRTACSGDHRKTQRENSSELHVPYLLHEFATHFNASFIFQEMALAFEPHQSPRVNREKASTIVAARFMPRVSPEVCCDCIGNHHEYDPLVSNIGLVFYQRMGQHCWTYVCGYDVVAC